MTTKTKAFMEKMGITPETLKTDPLYQRMKEDRMVTLYGVTYRHNPKNYWSWTCTLLALSLVVLAYLLLR